LFLSLWQGLQHSLQRTQNIHAQTLYSLNNKNKAAAKPSLCFSPHPNFHSTPTLGHLSWP
jgi:hypothetical protein